MVLMVFVVTLWTIGLLEDEDEFEHEFEDEVNEPSAVSFFCGILLVETPWATPGAVFNVFNVFNVLWTTATEDTLALLDGGGLDIVA